MDLQQILNGSDFDDQLIRDPEIRLILSDNMSFIPHGKFFLLLGFDP